MKTVLSLFSGCGGLDLGFEGGFWCLRKSINIERHREWIKEERGNYVLVKDTGFDTVFANDIRADAKTAWVRYFSKRHDNASEIYRLGSIVDLVKLAKAGEVVFPNNIDIVTGGFPCNDFSISGKRLGLNSDKSHTGKKLEIEEPSIENRGHLYMWMREVISITKPKMFIAENVKGLTNLGDVKQIIEHDFSEADGDGYLVVPAKVLHAADYGVPQSRERVFFFGFRKSRLKKKAIKELSKENIDQEYNPYPDPTHRYNFDSEGLMRFVNCMDAFVDLAEPEQSSDPSQQKYSVAKYMGKHCQGQTEIKLNDIGPTIRAEHHGNIEYRRLSLEHGGTHIDELNRGLRERRLSVRECARIQTFPDDYEFVIKGKNGEPNVPASNAYKIIGNAVPPVLAYNVAQNIKKKWDRYFKK